MIGFVGLILGVLYFFGGLVIDILVSVGLASTSFFETPGLSFGTVLAFQALIVMPLIGGVCGFILGLVEGYLFNLIVSRVADLDLNFEKK